MLKPSWIIGGSTGSTQLSPRRAGFATLTRRTCQNPQFSMTKIKLIDPESSSTTVPNKIYLKESWIASLSLAMTILKIRNVIAKECICTTVAIHFCYLILFYFVVLLYILITRYIRDSCGNKFGMTTQKSGHYEKTNILLVNKE